MKAHALGFSWEFTDGFKDNLSADDLGAHLASINNVEFPFNNYNRVVYAENRKDRVVGLLLTAKNHKSFCELRRNGEVKSINVRRAEKGSSLIDFNFFLIDKKYNRGLYQYYHNSCAANIFTRLCAAELEKVGARRIATEVTEAGGTKAISAKEHDQIVYKYSGDIICHLHVRKENFAAIVREMQNISLCEFNLSSILPEKTVWYRNLKGISREIKQRVSFQRKIDVDKRADAIIDLLNSGAATDIAVAGRDGEGIERVIHLANNPDSFSSWDYDTIANEMTFKPSEFAKSKFMVTLEALAERHKADFLHKKTQ